MKNFVSNLFLVFILFYSISALSTDRWNLENSTGYHVWEHYDICASVTKSFVEMTECGKYYRTKFCKSENQTCGQVGNNFVRYADTLAYEVKNNKMNPNKAMLKFLETRIDLENKYVSGSTVDLSG